MLGLLADLAADITAVGSAIVAILGAGAAAYLALRTGRQAKQVKRAIGGGLSLNTALPAAPIALTSSANTTVLPWIGTDSAPTWKQLSAVLPDGNLDPGAYNDCGETCVSMVVAPVRGCPVNPGSVRTSLGRSDGNALTNADDLVIALRYYSVKSHSEYAPAEEAWRSLKAITDAHRLCIALGAWANPTLALHWLLVTAISQGRMLYHNPWTGNRSWIEYADFMTAYKDELVVIEEHCHYNMTDHAAPA